MSLHLFLETLGSTASACSGNSPTVGIRPGKGRNMGRVGVRDSGVLESGGRVRVRVPLLQDSVFCCFTFFKNRNFSF